MLVFSMIQANINLFVGSRFRWLVAVDWKPPTALLTTTILMTTQTSDWLYVYLLTSLDPRRYMNSSPVFFYSTGLLVITLIVSRANVLVGGAWVVGESVHGILFLDMMHACMYSCSQPVCP